MDQAQSRDKDLAHSRGEPLFSTPRPVRSAEHTVPYEVIEGKDGLPNVYRCSATCQLPHMFTRHLLAADLEPGTGPVSFANRSEFEFARLLEFYGIVWEYEPRCFPIGFNAEGSPDRWFKPDFYLPAQDRFIELTTRARKATQDKKTKLRLLHEHHPQVRCMILYRNDYLNLAASFGLDVPDRLEGVTPHRTSATPAVAEAGTSADTVSGPLNR